MSETNCRNLGCSNMAVECSNCIKESNNKLRAELLQDEINFLENEADHLEMNIGNISLRNRKDIRVTIKNIKERIIKLKKQLGEFHAL